MKAEITLNGIVLRLRSAGDNLRFADVLTGELGVIEVSIKGGRRAASPTVTSTQLFAYSRLCLRRGRNGYSLDSAEPLNIFYALRGDLKRLALASYFAELVIYSVPPDEESGALRLFLNTLHFICADSMPLGVLKSVFELRHVAELGFLPDLGNCRVCGKCAGEGNKKFVFDSGSIVCGSCPGEGVILPNAVLAAMRHIISADYNKGLFSFKLGEKSSAQLGYITERYALEKLERGFKTLEFYKNLPE